MAQQRDMYNQYIPPNGYQPNPAYAQQQQQQQPQQQQQQPDAMSSPQQQQQMHRNYAPNPAYRPTPAFGQGLPPASSAAAYQQHIQMQQQLQQQTGYAGQQPQNMQFHQMNMPPQGYPPNVAFQQSMHRPPMHSQQMSPQMLQQMHQMQQQQQRPVYQGNMVYGMPPQNMMQQQMVRAPMHQMQQQQQAHRYGPPQQGQQNMMTWKMMSQGQMHQAQQHQQHSAPAPAPQKTRQSTRKTKKRIVYDEASSDEEEELVSVAAVEGQNYGIILLVYWLIFLLLGSAIWRVRRRSQWFRWQRFSKIQEKQKGKERSLCCRFWRKRGSCHYSYGHQGVWKDFGLSKEP